MTHLEAVNETYGQHFTKAFGFGVKLILAGLACLIHSVFPEIFKNTASSTIIGMNKELSQRQQLS